MRRPLAWDSDYTAWSHGWVIRPKLDAAAVCRFEQSRCDRRGQEAIRLRSCAKTLPQICGGLPLLLHRGELLRAFAEVRLACFESLVELRNSLSELAFPLVELFGKISQSIARRTSPLDGSV